MIFPVTAQKNFPSSITKVLLTKLPYIKGFWLVYSFLWSWVPRNKRLVEISVETDQRILFCTKLDPSNPAELYMIMEDRYDLGTGMTIWSLLQSGDMFFDIGANFGYFSRIGSSKIGKKGFVISVEPNPEAFRFLSHTKESNVWAIHKAAGSNSTNRYKMHQPFYRQTTGSRFDLHADGEMGSVCLDDIHRMLGYPKVPLVKIDTEGAELFVLKGAEEFLRKEQPFVIAEVFGHGQHFDHSTHEIYEYMKKLGYSFYYSIDDDTPSVVKLDKPGEGQILFSARDLPDETFRI
jgi:FkbM family methyltransferase